MGYSAADEQFTHQLPRPVDHLHDSEKSWSDRCYFNAHSPDGDLLLVTGYGNNPNSQSAHGYAKVSLADGRHWDLDGVRRVVDDRHDNHAGPMRWTCVEPLRHWVVEVGPNDSGIEWELHYEPTMPMWELLPIHIRKRGRVVADMFHIKQPGRYRGWVSIEGERTSVDGFSGGRDRTFGVRVADQVDFWIWFEAIFEDRAIEAWVWEDAEGGVDYVDGGVTYADGRQSARFVTFRHDIRFDGDRRRAVGADIEFMDTDGERHRLTGTAPRPDVNAYYGLGHTGRRRKGGKGFTYYAWDGNDEADLREVEGNAHAMDQLMDFEMDGMRGSGIFEILVQGDRYPRYPTWLGT